MGIGGGIVLVPGLYYGLSALGYDPSGLMHLVVGTSLAIMAPTGFSSARAHWKRGAVDKTLLKNIGLGILAGVGVGTVLAHYVSGEGLRAFFAVALMGLALLMLSNPARYAFRDTVPGQPWSGLFGACVGTISTLMGIGGAVMNVPFMSLCRVPMHKAVGTAAALGLFISVPGLIGFMVIGWEAEGLPPLSFGYVNALAWAVIVPFSVMIAPLGAHVAHSLPVEKLRRVFAFFLMILALRMLYEVFHG
ncbi:MAG: sulfite exporter TauE/SafE family protein [Rhodospirillales bacterium]|nr:sulfite exporter TauE/SafE family protein [Rhodospirillales bacterium]MCB9996422.1 sulfite exporter TauE/SafE family protein [Rhodospirillales bacterium]